MTALGPILLRHTPYPLMGISFTGWTTVLAFVLLAVGILAYYRQIFDVVGSFFKPGARRDSSLERRTQDLFHRYHKQDCLDHWTGEDD